MPKFLVEHIDSNRAVIKGQDARHICRVLRLDTGDFLDITNGKGDSFKASILSLSPSQVDLRLHEKHLKNFESPIRITLAVGMLKDKKMEELLRQSIELGIFKWQPVYCERSVPVHDEKRIISRLARWETIAREALKQCQRSRLPQVCVPVPLDELFQNSSRYDLKLAFWESQETGEVDSSAQKTPGVERILILIGPEGGFSSNEITTARDHGFEIQTLGPRILRAQTAAISACTLIQNRYGDL
ncbi:MAG: 16S rRNA (uracil(1498)-N(3))-methyltransferase [Desulfobacteraceae bacterium]|nr:MAG: 16S rRNA (uracil(1498)-N(3))-methyltransferase [Desulfobacteraceae bacterium]